MSLRGLALSLILACGSIALHAQVPPSLGCVDSETSTASCTVGSTLSIDFGALFDLPMLVDEINAGGVSLTYSFAITSGSLPPGLTLSPSGLLSGVFTESGHFEATMTISLTLTTPEGVFLSQPRSLSHCLSPVTRGLN